MRHIRWQILIAVGGLILVVGLLLGQTPNPSIATVQPVEGGAYAEALIGSPLRLNPLLEYQSQVDRDIDRLLYGALIRFDSRGIAQPELAESFAVSADATLYTFTIRDDARWHDGEPVTADDVVFTFTKFQDPSYPGPADLHQVWEEIEIRRLDELNVQFQLPDQFAPFLDFMTTGLLPDHLLRGVSAEELVDHPFNLEPVGSGPFQFESFLVDDEGEWSGVSLIANEDYFGGRPYLERVEFRFFSTPEQALQAYRDGEVQGIGTVGQSILPRVLAEPGLEVHSAISPYTGIVLLNTRHPEKTFLGEKTFRQALMHATNRQWLINTYLGGQAVVATGPILPDSWAFASGLEPIPFDPLRAAELLDELGWELPAGSAPGDEDAVRSLEDQVLELELAYPDEGTFPPIAEALAAAWGDLGIRVELVPIQPSRILPDLLEPREFEAVLTELDLSGYSDPDPYPFWHDTQVENGQNYAGFADRNISIWLEQARTTPDLERRIELYRDFQFRFRDQVPALVLYHPIYSYAISSGLQGAAIGPLLDPSDRFMGITEWFLLVRRGLGAPSPTPSAP